MKDSKPLLITLIVLLAAVLIGGAILFYFLYSKMGNVQKDISTEISDVENQVEELKAKEEVLIDDQEITDEKTPIADDEIEYYNSQYGFSLTFPEEWIGYKTKHRTLNWGEFTTDSIDFGFTSQDSLFNIAVFTKTQWQSLTPEEAHVTYLGQNSQYVFAWAMAQYTENAQMEKLWKQIPDIMETFVLDTK